MLSWPLYKHVGCLIDLKCINRLSTVYYLHPLLHQSFYDIQPGEMSPYGCILRQDLGQPAVRMNRRSHIDSLMSYGVSVAQRHCCLQLHHQCSIKSTSKL